MHKFYFNECLPAKPSGSLQEVFEKSIYGFNQLIKDNPDIEKGIITHKDPSEVSICDQTIASLIKSIGDPTLRRIAYSYFTKFPIDSLYEVDDIFDTENFDVIYLYDEREALNLAIAHKMDWFLYSLPLDDNLCNDQLTIQADTVDDIEIHNWYGANSTYIAQEVRNRSIVLEDKLDELKNNFEGKSCYLSSEFIKKFNSLGGVIQEFVINKFTDADNKNLLFPAQPGSNLIKSCRGKDNGETYELKSQSFGAIRIYFSCDENNIYMGVLSSKASGAGTEQSADIDRASKIIKKLKNK